MKKNVLIPLSFILLFLLTFGQTAHAQMENTCSSDDVRKKLIEQDPSIIFREASLEEYIQSFIAQHAGSMETARSGNYIIPVVFHIIHDYGTENISDEQVYDAIEKMNEDYSQTNPDFSETIAEFVGIAANVGIEFRLAQKNLGGGCVNGIERIPSLLTYAASDAAKLNPWQHGFYLNIWVVKTMPEGVAAYAYYPSSAEGFFAQYDGIICRYDYVGSIGASSTDGAHTLSHEAGHSLNLQHPWGNTNDPGIECGDDQVEDTPETKGWTSCNLAGEICNDGVIENVQNFMEYSYCSTMFTEGQKLRALAALNSPTANRNNLWQETTLELTGTNDGYVAPLCTAVADFYSDNRFICEGESVTFHDVSWNAPVSTRSWSFEGGTPSTSTDLNPSVSFSGTGWHMVTLTVTNDAGTDVKEISDYLYTSSETPTLTDSYYGDFNLEEEANANWAFYNKYHDEKFWQWRPTNGYGLGSGCAYLNSLFGASGDKDELISPSFNLSGSAADNIYFKYASTSWALFPDDITASIKMYYSTNCGISWILMIGTISGSDLITSFGGADDFAPTEESQWSIASFDIPAPAKSSKVKFKIEFNYDSYVNNVFIDDFNFFDSFLGIADAQAIKGFTISPNPVGSSSAVNVQYALENSSTITLNVYDITGNAVARISLGEQASGSHQISFNPAQYNLSAGCYVLRIEDGVSYSTAKLIVE